MTTSVALNVQKLLEFFYQTMTRDVLDDHTAQYKENLIPKVRQVACKE